MYTWVCWLACSFLLRVSWVHKFIILELRGKSGQRVVLQGLSEPLGALIALLFIKPFLTPLLLQYMLAFVGGIMARSLLRLASGCLRMHAKN